MTAQLPRPVREVPSGGAEGRSVVGYDGSSAASVALQWAAQRARRSGTPLVVLSAVDDVHAAHVGVDGTGAPGEPPQALEVGVAVEEAWRRAVGVAAEGAALAEAAGADARPVSVLGDAAAALVGASATAESVVVARRGGSGAAVPRVGRVAFSVVDAASSPVVLVRGAAHLPGPDHPVVVGLDGSPSSERAVGFAAGEAAAAGARLVLVAAWGAEHAVPGAPVRTTAWHRPPHAGAGDVEPAELEALARVRAATSLARAVAPVLTVERRTARATAAEALVDAARGGGLLVLGARGADEPATGRLGATTLSLLTSAPCPVAVVR